MPVHLNGIDSSIGSVRMCVSEAINVLGLELCLCGYADVKREEEKRRITILIFFSLCDF